MLSVGQESEMSAIRLQKDCNKFLEKTIKLKIRLKETKSTHT